MEKEGIPNDPPDIWIPVDEMERPSTANSAFPRASGITNLAARKTEPWLGRRNWAFQEERESRDIEVEIGFDRTVELSRQGIPASLKVIFCCRGPPEA